MGCYVKSVPEAKIREFKERLGWRHKKYELMFCLGVETGLRISDILRFKVGRVSNTMRISEGKTKKTRDIKVTAELLKRIKEYIREERLTYGDALFYSTQKNKRKAVSRIRAYQVFKAVADEVGLAQIGTHSMRKTFARHKYQESGGSMKAVQKELGHSNLETTIRYFMNVTELEVTDD